MSFIERLNNAMEQNNSLVCVGLDPIYQRLPDCVRGEKHAFYKFNKQIIDQTYDLVCAYKPQMAHYQGQSAEYELEKTIEYIHKNYPKIPVILDGKRGDIGSTAAFYAKEAFERYQADAATVNPYMGMDAVSPFIEYQDKGVVVLCRTSNARAGDIQDIELEGEPLYERIAKLATQDWNLYQNVLLVVGATNPSQLQKIRALAPDSIFLVPGVGAQGGKIEDIIPGLDAKGKGLVVNSSRGIIYAGQGKDFAQVAREAALTLRNEINTKR